MKIIKKISLRRGLMRMEEPNLGMASMNRWRYMDIGPYTLTPEQQLHKYSTKPKFTSLAWYIAAFLGCTSAIYWTVYSNQLNHNQLDTIYRYRYHQQEQGTTKLVSRMALFKIIMFFEENYFFSALFRKSKFAGKEMDYFTQAVIRYKQYQNFRKNKDRKYDFLELGVLDKFPYPKKSAQPGMESACLISFPIKKSSNYQQCILIIPLIMEYLSENNNQ